MRLNVSHSALPSVPERMQLRAEAKRLHTTVESLRSELELVAAAKNDADSRVGQLTRELRDVKMELTEVRDAAEAAEKMAKEKRISLDKRVAEQGERLRVVEDQLRLALEALALSDRVSAGYVAQCRQLESMVRKQVVRSVAISNGVLADCYPSCCWLLEISRLTQTVAHPVRTDDAQAGRAVRHARVSRRRERRVARGSRNWWPSASGWFSAHRLIFQA